MMSVDRMLELAGIRSSTVEAAAFKSLIREIWKGDSYPLAAAIVPRIPSANDMWASKSRRTWDLSDRYKAWLDEAMPIFSLAVKRIDEPVRIKVARLWPYGSRSNFDIDNLMKPCIDGIVKAGVVPDDKVQYVRGAGSEAYQVEPLAQGKITICHDLVLVDRFAPVISVI